MPNKEKIIVGINASFIRKSAGGIGQVTWHFLKTLFNFVQQDRWANFYFYVYLEEELSKEFLKGIKIPDNICFKILQSRFYRRDDLLRKIYWEKFLLPSCLEKDRCQFLLSLYQSTTVLRKDIKHIMLVHDIVPDRFPQYLNNFRKKVYYYLVDRAVRKSNQIMTISNFSQKEIALKYGLVKKDIIVNKIACDPLFKKKVNPEKAIFKLKKYGINKSDKFIFYVGGFDVRKNIDVLIKSYALWISEFKQDIIPRLVLGGEYHKHLVPLVTDINRMIENVCDKYKISKNNFLLTGFIRQTDLPFFYQRANFFVYPSLYEGFGLPVLEAMVSECLVVTSRSSSLSEVIGENGVFIKNSGSVKSVRNALSQAWKLNKNERMKIIQLAKKRSQQFSWQQFTKNILKNIR